jgi:hypothetical protein
MFSITCLTIKTTVSSSIALYKSSYIERTVLTDYFDKTLEIVPKNQNNPLEGEYSALNDKIS